MQVRNNKYTKYLAIDMYHTSFLAHSSSSLPSGAVLRIRRYEARKVSAVCSVESTSAFTALYGSTDMEREEGKKQGYSGLRSSLTFCAERPNYIIRLTAQALEFYPDLKTMPRATSDKFNKLHQASAKVGKQKNEKETSGGGGSSGGNPIFKTERFGQHILKSGQVAQKLVISTICSW